MGGQHAWLAIEQALQDVEREDVLFNLLVIGRCRP
jgi:hypothetical protein